MSDDVVKWLFSLATATVAAYLGSFLALRKTKRDAKWQATYGAYAKILAAVESMRICAEETYASRLLLPSLTDAKLEELGHKYQDAKRELWSYVRVGELVISPDAQDRLTKLLSDIAAEEIRFEDEPMSEQQRSAQEAEHSDRLRKTIDSALPAILGIAKRDIA